MGANDVLSRKTGVIVGDDVMKLFNYVSGPTIYITARTRGQWPVTQ